MSRERENEFLQNVNDVKYEQDSETTGGVRENTPLNSNSGDGFFGNLFTAVFFIGGAIFWLYVFITWLF